LTWPDGVIPSEASNFESVARRLRYQALGRACWKHKINALFLAHHEDDQVETMLMRIAHGHKTVGLRGILPEAGIPECFGIYGVHQSGLQAISRPKNAERFNNGGEDDPKMPKDNKDYVVGHESGGVTIYRPLLSFGKDRLIATCIELSMPWVEDITNKDPTFTMRNAVRHLLATDSLPIALRKPSLLSLAQKRDEMAESVRTRVEKSFGRCEIITFDTRAGTLIIRLPSPRIFDCSAAPQEFRWKRLQQTQHIAAALLRRVIELVTPRESIPLESLCTACNNIFQLGAPNSDDATRTQSSSSFTTADVKFERLERVPSPFEVKQHDTLDPKFVWQLSRQPLGRNASQLHIQIHPNQSSLRANVVNNSDKILYGQDISVCRSLYEMKEREDRWSPWTLFDGRYWLRVLNKGSSPILIRHLQPDDMKRFRRAMAAEKKLDDFQNMISTIAPGSVRYTLPAVVAKGLDGKEVVLGLPTMGCRLAETDGVVDWEVRYKFINLGLHAGSKMP
jgi:hypothetical protein